MLRRSYVVLCALVALVVAAFTTLLWALLSVAPDADGFVPMSVTHEQFYIAPPERPIRPPPKYFFEAVVKNDKHWVGLHYDRRYFKSELSDELRECAIHYMLEAWFAFLDENKIESWIAHGTLLGWYWNGETLPWDVDVDVQMFVRTMDRMSKRFNATSYEYTTAENEVRKYYIDVNPYFVYRSRMNAQNVIDARFVDMQSGLYIDITALAEVDPMRHPNVISCKNNHRYLVDDILPLRQTMFVGRHAYIPYEFEKILQKEYSQSALINGRYMGYIFSVTDQKWIKESVFRDLHRGKSDIGRGPVDEPLQRLPTGAGGHLSSSSTRLLIGVPGARAKSAAASAAVESGLSSAATVTSPEYSNTISDTMHSTEDNRSALPAGQPSQGFAVGGGAKGHAK
ncbi:LicD family-domain-containing protein [Lipomyces tetrasporus]